MTDPGRTDKERVVGIFNRSAATYDRVGPRFFSHFGQRLADFAQLGAGLHVLDIAAGRGAVLVPTAQRVGASGRVVGIDLSADMVRETSADIHNAGWRNVEMRQMDAEHLEFPDAAFDRVVCGFALWFFPDPSSALREIRRVLKPGGFFALTTWAQDNPAQLFARGVLRPFLPPGSSGATRQDAIQFNTPAQIENALQQAGFDGIRTAAEEHDFVYADADAWWATLWSLGVRGNLEKLTTAVLEEVKAAGFEQVGKLRQADGIHIAHKALFGIGVKPAQGVK